MSEKDSIYWRKKMLKLASKILQSSGNIHNLCIDDFLDGMGPANEKENCQKAKELLSCLMAGLNERLQDIRLEEQLASHKEFLESLRDRFGGGEG